MNTNEHKLKKGGKRLIVGVMSGTSVDGIDAALVEATGVGGGYGARVVHHVERKWPTNVRERLMGVMAPAMASVGEICELNVLVAREFALAVEDCLGMARVRREEVTAIGSHGQTICHLPVENAKRSPPQTRNAKRRMGSTLQLGDVSVIATLTGILTVGNFRPADMAVGGQGAPLVPWADEVLLSHETKARAVQNIGGIANVTYLPGNALRHNGTEALREVVAFDTGSGNMVMDAVMSIATGGRKGFDAGGAVAGRGKVIEEMLKELKGHAYFRRRPPKSTGRELFGRGFAEGVWQKWGKKGLEDVMCTLCAWTAWSIGDAYRRFLPGMPEEVIVCGGGVENGVLMGILQEELGGIEVRRIDEFGIPNKAKEAASFALLAAATLDGVAGNLVSVTGASRPVVLGEVARP